MIYVYQCPSCGHPSELSHSIAQLSEKHLCPDCETDMIRVPQSFGLTHGSTLALNHKKDSIKSSVDLKHNLAENYGVHDVSPLQGQTLSDVARDIKSRGNFVRDQMQATVQQNREKADKKAREFLKTPAAKPIKK